MSAPEPQPVREPIRQAVAFRTWTRLLDMPGVRIYLEADPAVSGGIVITAKSTGNRLIDEIVARASAPAKQQPAGATGGEQGQNPRGSFWADLDRHLEDPEFRKAYVEQSLRLQEAEAEHAQEGAAGRVEALLQHKPRVLTHHEEADLRAVLAERDALAARVAELTADREADAQAVAMYLDASHEDAAPVDPAPRTVLKQHFADRIAALAAKPACLCGCQPGRCQDCDGCPCAGNCPVCDVDADGGAE